MGDPLTTVTAGYLHRQRHVLDSSRKLYTVCWVTSLAVDGAHRADLTRLLARDYWLILSTPLDSTTAEAVGALVHEHVQWLLELERDEVLFLSGPLLEGPSVGPGSGVTVLRAADEDAARAVAEQDPFVRAGLRTFAVYRWQLNEGSVSVRMSLGTGRYEWA